MVSSIFQSFQAGFEGGQAVARQRRADQASLNASALYQGGDVRGAESVFLREGMLGEAAQVGEMGERNQQREGRERVRTAMTGATGTLLDRMRAGQTAALETGDIDMAAQLSSMSADQVEQARESARVMGGSLLALTEVPMAQRRQAALQVAQHLQLPADQVAQIQNAPEEFFSDESLQTNARGLQDIESQLNMRYQRGRDTVEDARANRELDIRERESGTRTRSSGRRMRLDWERSQEDFIARRDGLQQLTSLRDEATGPGAISFIFTYMKMLDPTSVVREGEYATAANAGGVNESVRNAYNRAIRGDALSTEVRDQYISAARAMYDTRAQQHARDLRYWRGVAETEGVDPDQIRSLAIEEAAPSADRPEPDRQQDRPQGPPPREHISMLRANPTPEMRAFFDERYGAGAAERVLGQAQRRDEVRRAMRSDSNGNFMVR